MPKMTKKVKRTESVEHVEIIHPEVRVEVCAGENAITVAFAKELLGWQEEEPQTDSSSGIKFGGDYLLIDETGKKIRCLYNAKNRPFNENWAKTLAQDILNRRWRMNGETVIIGKTGQVVSAQHRLIGLVYAGQAWASDKQGLYWKEKWETEPTIEAVIVYGVEESADVTRTLDNVRPRTLADVLFTDPIFGSTKPKDRRPLTRIMDYAVRLLWHRTGADNNAFVPRRTHSEALDFIGRHPRLMKCVKHIYDEDQERSISKHLSPGTAAALMYLMASSKSDGDEYRNMEPPAESKNLDWELWHKASEFWVLLSANSPDFKNLSKAIADLHNQEGGAATMQEKLAVLIKAWGAYLEDGRITLKDLELHTTLNGDGIRVLHEYPNLGGLDLGEPDDEKPEPDEPTEEEITPEQLEAEKEAARLRREEKKKALLENRKNGKKAATPSKDGYVERNAANTKRNPTRKEVEAEQTRKAREADELLNVEDDEQLVEIEGE